MARLFVILAAFMLFPLAGYTQDDILTIINNGRWSRFEGGDAALKKWISENRKYPQEAIAASEQGVVEVGFVVEIDGSLSSIEVKKSISPLLDKEAIRLAKSMPKWEPAFSDGAPCRTRNAFSVQFVLPKTAVSSAVRNQTQVDWSTTNGHKIYEGEYKLMGTGQAKYQYIDGPDGRIFDGHFVYSSSSIHAEGDFKNNRQVGVWYWENTSKKEKAEIHFNKDGELAGDFDFVWNGIQAKGFLSKSVKPGRNYSFYNYISELSTNDGNGISAEGSYNVENRPVGEWKVQNYRKTMFRTHGYSGYEGEMTYAIYDYGGNIKEWYFFDSSVGDKRLMPKNNVDNLLRNINDGVWSILKKFIMRQTDFLHDY